MEGIRMTLKELIIRLNVLKNEYGVSENAQIFVNDSFGGIIIADNVSRYVRAVYNDEQEILNESEDIIIY